MGLKDTFLCEEDEGNKMKEYGEKHLPPFDRKNSNKGETVGGHPTIQTATINRKTGKENK